MSVKRLFWLVILLLCFVSLPAYAQFGKNNVRDHPLDKLYMSYRFDIHHNLDTEDPAQMEYLRQLVDYLESSRNWMSSPKVFGHNIEKRIPVFFYKTHSDMESSNLVGGFLPEGVGAFVEWERGRMVLKGDFSNPLGRAIGVHELVHEFQRDMEKSGLIQRVIGAARLPDGYYEGCAEFIAGLYDPHTRDDIRRREQRNFASNPKTLPTWEALNRSDGVNPYTMWSMVPEFLEDKYAGGLAFCTQPLKSKVGLGEFVYDLTKGELGNPDVNSEKFDERARQYWGKEKGFEIDRINSPNPYEENDNFKGRTLTPYGHPYPMRSPILSSDGSEIAAFTVQKNGIALVRYKIPEERLYLSPEERQKAKAKERGIVRRVNVGFNPLTNLTPQLPPVPWEYLVVQGFETWPFNGFDASWSRDGKRIAFFARINRDHALVIIDAETGKVLNKIELESAGLKLDQAFSPSFTMDGNTVIFSAVSNLTRDLYSLDINSQNITNLTKDERFDTAPATSPYGSKIVYVGSDGDFQHLFMLDLADGRTEQLTFGSFNDSSPNWSDDGFTLVYTSDEDGGVWNLYTLELATRNVSQWTKFTTGVETPLFARNNSTTVYYVVFRDDDQYRDFIYPNYEIFEAKLKQPVRQYKISETKVLNSFIFNPDRDLFKVQLDSNQALNPKKPTEQWGCGGGNVSFGLSTYWGMFGQSYFGCSNLLETKQHLGLFVSYGSFKMFEYAYVNREKRLSWQLGAGHRQIPLYYQFYDIVNRYPHQRLLNSTWATETSIDLSAQYPLNKFNRWEMFSRLQRRSFNSFGYNVFDIDEEILEQYPEDYTPQDIQMLRVFKAASGSSIGFGAAYVRDTVLYSNDTWGPLHGNALRAQINVAPHLGKEFDGYVSTNVQARTYRRLIGSVLFAGRADLMASSRASGDFLLLCGPERLRGCDYGSIGGNQIAYGSAELRFPLIDAVVTTGGLNLGGARGLLFVDGAISKFKDERFPAQKLRSYGFGVQYIIPFIGLPGESIWKRENGTWNPSFYITMNW